MYSTIKEAVNKFYDWEVCNTVLWAKTSEKSYKLSNENSESGYIPIGLYVVPAEHIHDGFHRFMSLKYMNYSTPSTGSISTQGMYWGNYQNNIEGLKNLEAVNLYKDDNSLEMCTLSAKDGNDNVLARKIIMRGNIDNILSKSHFGCLPSDAFSSGSDKLNSAFKYYDSSLNDKIPCPYANNNLLNLCFIDKTKNTGNALADFSGKQNTQLIVKSVTSQLDWKTSSTITNNYDAGYAPASCCCQRYNPDGFTKFQWYLPSCGELAYVCVKQTAINNKLSSLSSNYSGLIISSLASYYFWTSSSCSAECMYYVALNYGYVDWGFRNRSGYIVAFLND